MEHPITKHRRIASLTMEAFGNIVGVPKGTVSKWEACQVFPRPGAIEKIECETKGAVSASDLVRAFNDFNRCAEAAK